MHHFSAAFTTTTEEKPSQILLESLTHIYTWSSEAGIYSMAAAIIHFAVAASILSIYHHTYVWDSLRNLSDGPKGVA